MEFPIRLNKYLAHAGFATRRSADTLIAEGRVFVNGKPALMGQKIEEADKVEIKNHDTSHHQYILYFKPLGISSQSTEGETADIVSRIKRDHKITGVFPIGRLDKQTEGLIILTDDGRITSRILDQKYVAEQEYEVHVDKRVTQTFLNRLSKGVRIGGYTTHSTQANISKENDHEFTIVLTEGRKYHIRRMCAMLGYSVTGLKRTRIADFSLRNLKPGGFYRLTPKDATILQSNFGLQ
jgi:23S rRNA pseudouridine2604 synthase